MSAAAPRDDLRFVAGCGRCADLCAAHLLGAPVYERLVAHLDQHEFKPSIWPEVNDLARRVRGASSSGVTGEDPS